MTTNSKGGVFFSDLDNNKLRSIIGRLPNSNFCLLLNNTNVIIRSIKEFETRTEERKEF